MNFRKFYTKKAIGIAIAIVLVLIAVGIYYVEYLEKAHSTFENYYKFRGCVELVERTDTYGICKLESGETIKIVKYDNRWFLDGDLP